MPVRKTDYDKKQKNQISVRNDFVRAIHPDGMDLNAMKLFRLVISQCRKNDTELYTYDFKISELAEAIGINSSNIYRDTKVMCIKLMQMILLSGDVDPRKSWKLKHIFESCEYSSETGTITIKLHEDMSELVLRLDGQYTQIPVSAVLMMKSKYAIRLYELICQKMFGKRPHANVAVGIQLSIEEIREITKTDKKKSYDKISNLKNKVLLPAIRDIEAATPFKGIEEYSGWKIDVKDIKRGRQIVGFNLEIWSRSGWEVVEKCKREGTLPPRPKYKDENSMDGQMTIYDFLEK